MVLIVCCKVYPGGPEIFDGIELVAKTSDIQTTNFYMSMFRSLTHVNNIIYSFI